MARNGYYPVKLVDDHPKDWEVRRCQATRSCWGVELETYLGVLNTYGSGCSGKIQSGEFYVVAPDRRDPARQWSICMFCMVEYHEEKLEGDLTEYRNITQEDIDRSRRELPELLKEIHNLAVPGGVHASREPVLGG